MASHILITVQGGTCALTKQECGTYTAYDSHIADLLPSMENATGEGGRILLLIHLDVDLPTCTVN